MNLSELLQLKNNRIRLNTLRDNRESVVPFVGAGISVACGLSSWTTLLEDLASEFLPVNKRIKIDNSTDYLQYAESIVRETGNSNIVMKRIAEMIQSKDISMSKAPFLLVSSFSNNIVTTNYDTILELASKKMGSSYQLKPLLPCLTDQMTAAIQGNKRCLLKMHGSIEETSSMIFSKTQYNDFYGAPNNYDSKSLPLFLQTIFSGKSLLFVGCSLSQDRTMDVLAHCLKKNQNITHYAIVELPTDSEREIQQLNYLSSLGIIPIYYPEKKYESVDLLLEYLAKDNAFIREAKKVLSRYIDTTDPSFDLLCSIINESYYNTALTFPELLDLTECTLNIINDYNSAINVSEKTNESLYDTCIHIFESLCRSGIYASEDIFNCLIKCFSDAALRETDIKDILRDRHNIYQTDPLDIAGKKDKDLTILADELNRKIQFENEMSFRDFTKYYNQAVELLESSYDKIEMKQRVLLCNTVGAWGTYVLNPEKSIKYLKDAISTIESLSQEEQPDGLLSQCYCNLGLIYANINSNYESAIECAEKDIELKQKANINPRLLAGSIGHYGLYQQELYPIDAVETHIKSITLKRTNIDNADILRFERDKNVNTETMRIKLIASWATGVFDLGLLAKDLMLYKEASQLITIANNYRYKIVDKVNKDYNASLNAEVEIKILLRQKQDIQEYISAIKGRLDLNPQLSSIIFHSWYVCALYYYTHESYDTAMHYIREFNRDYLFNNHIKDIRLEVRANILESRILLKNSTDIHRVQTILDNTIERIVDLYTQDSFWLIEPYTLYSQISETYKTELRRLKEKYTIPREKTLSKLDQFINTILMTKP